MHGFSKISVILPCAAAILGGNQLTNENSGVLGDEGFLFTSEVLDALKEAETYYTKLDEERKALFLTSPQNALLGANRTFSYPAGCTPKNQTPGYPFCFYGQIDKTLDEETVVDAIVDFFDINDSQENAVVGFKATYDKEGDPVKLRSHTGGKAELFTFGNKAKVGASVFLATYDGDDSPSGSGGRMQEGFDSNLHIIVYGLKRQLFNIEHVAEKMHEVYAGKNYNCGFNISANMEKEIPKSFGSIAGTELKMSLTTFKGNVSSWRLNGQALAYVKTKITTFKFPYTYIDAKISIPQ